MKAWESSTELTECTGRCPQMAASTDPEGHYIAAIQGGRPGAGIKAASGGPQISVCSEISRASSTSMPKYLTVDSSFA